jgi:SOS-response transcriptional repressor LexA
MIRQGEEIRRREKGVRLKKVAVLAIALQADGRSQKEIAEACQSLPDGKGITPSVLSEYANEKRPIGETHLRVIATVIGMRPSLLAHDLSKDELFQLLEGHVGAAAEPVRHLRLMEVDPSLDVIAAVDRNPREKQVDVWVYASLAAGGLDDRTAEKEPEPIWLDSAAYRKCKAVRVDGDSMIGAGIEHGDVLIVRQSRSAKEGDIVIGLVEHEGTIKRLRTVNGEQMLCPENPKYSNIPLREPTRLQGVAVAIYKPNK